MTLNDIYHALDPVAFTIGPFQVRWYGMAYIVGFCCGACIGSYYSTNDVLIMMIGESAPTNLRSSAIAAQYIVVGIGFGITYMVAIPLATALGNAAVGMVALCFLVPGFLSALVALWRRTADTKGLDLDTVTGCEWD